MKMSKDRYELIRDAIKAVYDNRDEQEFDDFYRDQSLMRIMWDLFRVAHFDMQFDDSHPAFASGRRSRIVKYCEFTMYVDGLDDSHYNTALKSIAKELGITGVTKQ